SGYQAEQAPAPVRQEAAVKSIAPPKPVPAARPVVAAAPQAQGGLLDRIVGWFKKRSEDMPAAETPPTEAVAAITRSERPSERRERSSERKPGQRRGRGEGRTGEARGGESRGDARQAEPRQNAPRQNEARGSDTTDKPARPPRQPKPRPEADAAPRVTEAVEAPREIGGEEKRESRSRRGRGNRRPREARPEGATSTPMAVIEIAGFRAIVEVARAPKAVSTPQASTQQDLQLESAATSSVPAAVTASPTAILASMATRAANLQQVETQGIAVSTSDMQDAGRPRRRRRPAAKPETESSSLMQVETSAAIAPVVEAAAADAPHPTRRRQRPQVSASQEPLVQVETQAK
ncbi:MAG: ribonuclease, partial [Proteobacteria bacterium]|nr:ribonuclease [Pseudomonadota bacterium]